MVKRAEELELDGLIEGAGRLQSLSEFTGGRLCALIAEKEFAAAKRHFECGNFYAAIECLKRGKRFLL